MIPKTIVAIGASSVFGKIDPEGGFIGRFKTWHEFIDLEENSVYNLGIPGDTTTGMIKRASLEIAIREPDLVIFSLGSNDTARNGSKDGKITTNINGFKKNVKELIYISNKLAKKTIFVGSYPINDTLTKPFKGTDKYYSMKDLSLYISETKKICLDMGVPYLDIFNLFLAENYKDYIYTDGLHCNDKGHDRICTELRNFFNSLYS